MRKKAEGIALLSLYNDDDEEEDEEENPGAAPGPDSGAGLGSQAAPEDPTPAATEIKPEEPVAIEIEDDPSINNQPVAEELDDQLLSEFLPPPSTARCPDDLQDKFAFFLRLLREDGRSYNDELRKSKGYRNPDFLHRAVLHEGVDQIGSCFRKEIFDPYGYDPEDFYDVLISQQNRELERRAQEMKQNKRMEFVRPIQAGAWMNPAAAAAGAAAAASAPAPVAKPEGRANKKSKWDKVEPEVRAVPGLQNAMAIAAQAAAMISANQQHKRNP